jgi:hypothetical protein
VDEIFDPIERMSYALVHDNGGAEKLAPRVLVKPGTLNHKVNPTMEGHHLTLQEAIALMLATDDYRLLHSVCDQLGFQCVPSVDVEGVADMEFLSLFAKTMTQIGYLSATISDALEDGTITKDEVKSVSDATVAAMSVIAKLPERMGGMSDE